MWKNRSKKNQEHTALVCSWFFASSYPLCRGGPLAARASPVGADAHIGPPAGGDKPRPYAPGETLVRRKRRPTLWGPRGQKEDAVIPRAA